MSSSLSVPVFKFSSGRALDGEAREIVYNVATYLKNMKRLYKFNYNVTESTSVATGVSDHTVYRILKEGKELAAKGNLNFTTPDGKRHPRKKRIQLDDAKKCAIKEKFLELQKLKGEVPTVKELTKVLNEENILYCSKEYMRCLLETLGLRSVKSKRKEPERQNVKTEPTEHSASDEGEDKNKDNM